MGTTFEVNASVSFNPDEAVTHLHQTINYVTIFEIIKSRMQIATPLLETLVQDLTGEIKKMDDRVKSVWVSVEKKNPPISNMEGSVSVQYKKDF